MVLEVALTDLAEQWVCSYSGRAGAKASAVFATQEEAKAFVERHAQLTSARAPLEWNDNGDSTTVTTPTAVYRIARADPAWADEAR